MTPRVMEGTRPSAAGTRALHTSLPAAQKSTSSAFVCILYVTPACIYIYLHATRIVD